MDNLRKKVKQLKEEYPIGTRVKLIYMEDEQAPPNGTLGTVVGVDDMGTILVSWDSGSTLSLVPNVDIFLKILY